MPGSDGFSSHWVDIDPERMERYESMFRWTPASERFYADAAIGEGHVVADLGCAVGDAAMEFARRVGPCGHVHGLDINAQFIERAIQRAAAAGLGERMTFHLLTDSRLPLADASLDRAVTRNTLIYVEDPLLMMTQLRRALRPGGLFHAVESDWDMTVVEPVPTATWRELVQAASWAWPRPEMGRQLYGLASRSGFREVTLQVMTAPDTDGRLLGMIRTVIGYARDSGAVAPGTLDAILDTIERAMADGTYLALAPQFLVTATA